MEITRTLEHARCSCVLITLKVQLTAFIFWIMLVHPSGALYLDFQSSHHAEQDSSNVPRDGLGHETLSWAVKIQHQTHRKSVNRTHVDLLADVIAEELGLKNYGQVGELLGHYLFAAESYQEALNGSMELDLVGKIRSKAESALARHSMIEWFNQQTIRRRFKRSLVFTDPSYPNQWHLHNSKNVGMDINVTGIWEHNITGSGVTVAVIDDGLEWTNEDIAENYCPEGSWDLNSNDNNPAPEMRIKDGKQTQNRHGTRCAGEIAAVRNKVCGVGVAFSSKVSGIRLLDGPMTDSLEATAFNKFMYINDIYSCSWGPDDDGKTVDGPHTLAKAALQHGVTYGRRGRGSIFVVASGNGGKNGDNCNYDGYANSMYTVTIGAVDERGQMPFYAEECASLFAVTFSSGSRPQRNILTTDWTLGPGTGCTNTHTGTSAAAPLAAGMISLMLEAKPCLSWRDVQHIIVYSALKIDSKKGEWSVNAAGFHHSHKHGFGVLKAWRLVNAAKVWPSVPWLTSVITPTLKVHRAIPTVQGSSQLMVNYEVTNATARTNELATLEHVLITISLTHSMRGKLKIELVCPSGTRSVIGAKRKKDNSRDGLHNWTFSTVRCWGEDPVGTWQLIITDFSNVGGGVLEEWTLALYGSNMKPEDVANRKAMVEESYGGEFLDTNLTEPCSFYWATPIEEETYLSMKTIKFLLLISAFATVLALYYSLEQAFCTDEEKRKHATKLGLDKPTGGCGGENQELLQEQNIAMDDLTSTLTSDLTSVDLREVTPDTGQESEVDATYTCAVPVVCVEVDKDSEENLGRSRVNGEGYLSNVQSVVCSDSHVLRSSAEKDCISVQPVVPGSSIQRTFVDTIRYCPNNKSKDSTDVPPCPAAQRTISPEIQAAASQLVSLEEESVNPPIPSLETNVQPLIQTIDTEQTTPLVHSTVGSSVQPTTLPETLHSRTTNLERQAGDEHIAPSTLHSDAADSNLLHTHSSDSCTNLANDVPLIHAPDNSGVRPNTKEHLNQSALEFDNSQGPPVEWKAPVLTDSAQGDWTTPTFDAFQPVPTDTATNKTIEQVSSVLDVEVRSQTPPFLSHR